MLQGIDMIGPYLTEINVTSPTGLCRNTRDLTACGSPAQIWDAIESKRSLSVQKSFKP